MAVLAEVVERRADPGVHVLDDRAARRGVAAPGRRSTAAIPGMTIRELGDEVVGGEVRVGVGQDVDERGASVR